MIILESNSRKIKRSISTVNTDKTIFIEFLILKPSPFLVAFEVSFVLFSFYLYNAYFETILVLHGARDQSFLQVVLS